MPINKDKKKVISMLNTKIKPVKEIVKKSSHKSKKILTIIFFVGILLIVSTYAWLSTTLNVRVKNFNMIVSKNNGLSVSFDGINFDTMIEISRDFLFEDLPKTYPNNYTHWSQLGLKPVSTNGISNPNSQFFDIFASGGVRYANKKKEHGYFRTLLYEQNSSNDLSYFIAFDLFLKNDSGSPQPDNLFLDRDTQITIDSNDSEQMQGLLNSMRIGIVKIGSVNIKSDVNTIQNISCNNNCSQTIFEPFSKVHNNFSIEKAAKYGINLNDGEYFPTYASIKEGGPIFLEDAVSGSTNLDLTYFGLQNTITEADFDKPLFQIPYGITKVRVYVWVEGQDIDSLETDSEGAEISISISFAKDTFGYETYD